MPGSSTMAQRVDAPSPPCGRSRGSSGTSPWHAWIGPTGAAPAVARRQHRVGRGLGPEQGHARPSHQVPAAGASPWGRCPRTRRPGPPTPAGRRTGGGSGAERRPTAGGGRRDSQIRGRSRRTPPRARPLEQPNDLVALEADAPGPRRRGRGRRRPPGSPPGAPARRFRARGRARRQRRRRHRGGERGHVGHFGVGDDRDRPEAGHDVFDPPVGARPRRRPGSGRQAGLASRCRPEGRRPRHQRRSRRQVVPARRPAHDTKAPQRHPRRVRGRPARAGPAARAPGVSPCTQIDVAAIGINVPSTAVTRWSRTIHGPVGGHLTGSVSTDPATVRGAISPSGSSAPVGEGLDGDPHPGRLGDPHRREPVGARRARPPSSKLTSTTAPRTPRPATWGDRARRGASRSGHASRIPALRRRGRRSGARPPP